MGVKVKMKPHSASAEYAEKIKTMREMLGLSQKELAEALGIGQPVVSAWEGAKYPPSAGAYLQLSNLVPVESWRLGVWFWEQAGLATATVLPVAFEMLTARGQEPKIGEVIRIPANEQMGEHESPILFATALIPNPASTSYMKVPDDFLGPMFNRGDILLVDNSVTDMRRLLGSYVAIYNRSPLEPHVIVAQKKAMKYRKEEAQKLKLLGGYPFEHPGLVAGLLGTREGYSSRHHKAPPTDFVIVGPKRGIDQIEQVIAFERFAGNPVEMAQSLIFLGRVIAWISARELPSTRFHRGIQKRR